MLLALMAVAACAAALAACGSSDPDPGAGATQAATATAVAAPADRAPASSGSCASGRSTTAVPGAPLPTILRVSAGPRTRRAPLVLALHFAGGDGGEMERQTGLTAEARRAGFDVAYPTATAGGFWQSSDLPKLRRTIAAIERYACVDTRRVYLVGWSNGGGMAALAACRMPETVAAVALFAPAVDLGATCTPSRAPSVLEVHGTADAIVPYGDGRAFIGDWARRDGCGASPTTARVGPRGTTLRWRGCRDDADVEHLRVAGARHVELFRDLRAAGIDPNVAAWRFLSAHRVG